MEGWNLDYWSAGQCFPASSNLILAPQRLYYPCTPESGGKPVRSYVQGCNLTVLAFCLRTRQCNTQPGTVLSPSLSFCPKWWPGSCSGTTKHHHLLFKNFLGGGGCKLGIKLLASSLPFKLRMPSGLQIHRPLLPKQGSPSRSKYEFDITLRKTVSRSKGIASITNHRLPSWKRVYRGINATLPNFKRTHTTYVTVYFVCFFKSTTFVIILTWFI